MTELKIKGMKEFNRAFINFNGANKEAVKNTLNICASVSRKNYIKNIDKGFYDKTGKGLIQSRISVVRANQEEIKNMESKVGAGRRVPYMLVQEEGGKRYKHSANYSIATKHSRDGNNLNIVNPKLYLRTSARRKLKGSPNVRRSRKSQRVADMYMTNKLSDKRERMMFYKWRNAMYEVNDFMKLNRNTPLIKMTKMYILKKSPIKIKGRHYLEKAIDNPSKDIDTIYEKQLKKAWKKEI